MRRLRETIERGWLSSVHHVKKANSFSGGMMCNVIGQCCDSELWPSAACLLQPHLPGFWEGCQCYWSMGALALIMSNPLHVHFPSLLSSGLRLPSTSQSLWAMNWAAHTSEKEVVVLHKFTLIFFLLYVVFIFTVAIFSSSQSAAQTVHTTMWVVHIQKHSQKRIICGGT